MLEEIANMISRLKVDEAAMVSKIELQVIHDRLTRLKLLEEKQRLINTTKGT